MAKDHRRPPSAADLLGDWRAAERDTVAATAALSVAELALAAALATKQSAAETDRSAQAAVALAKEAQQAAEQAAAATTQASETAIMLAAKAGDEQIQAAAALAAATAAEDLARDRFHEAEKKGFPKEPK